jgi:hypothetical protein
MNIKRARLELIKANAKLGATVVSPAELVELCNLGLARLHANEYAERERVELAAAAKDKPTICQLCNREIKDGEPTRAGEVHWACYEKARKMK